MSFKAGNNMSLVNMRDGMIDPGFSSPLYISSNSFSVAGDVTDFLRAGRGVRLTFASSGEKVCIITSLSYSAGITTIVVSGDSLVNEVITKAEVSFSDLEAMKNYSGIFDRFHWLTVFESLDGFNDWGTGTITNDKDEIVITTGATSGNEKRLHKVINNMIVSFIWAKSRRMRTAIETAEITNSEKWIISGGPNTARHIGFKIIDNTLYGTVADGGTEATLNCGTISANTSYKLEVIFETESKAKFYVDGVLKGEITANLPSASSADASKLFYAYVKTNENAAKTLKISAFEMEQTL